MRTSFTSTQLSVAESRCSQYKSVRPHRSPQNCALYRSASNPSSLTTGWENAENSRTPYLAANCVHHVIVSAVSRARSNSPSDTTSTGAGNDCAVNGTRPASRVAVVHAGSRTAFRRSASAPNEAQRRSLRQRTGKGVARTTIRDGTGRYIASRFAKIPVSNAAFSAGGFCRYVHEDSFIESRLRVGPAVCGGVMPKPTHPIITILQAFIVHPLSTTAIHPFLSCLSVHRSEQSIRDVATVVSDL
jgi:hypothetical protein